MFSYISSDNACESPTYKKATIFNLSNWLFQKESQFHAVKGFSGQGTEAIKKNTVIVVIYAWENFH